MPWEPIKPIRTRCDLLRTLMSVVSTLCLLVISTTLLGAGVYTVHTVEKLQSTYHPEKLGNVFDKASSALESFHKTATMLQRSHGESSESVLPTMLQDARLTMSNAHDSLVLGHELLQTPEVKTVLRELPKAVELLRAALPHDDNFYKSIGLALSDLSWVYQLTGSLISLSTSVDSLDVDNLLVESQAWRNMSVVTVSKLKSILHGI